MSAFIFCQLSPCTIKDLTRKCLLTKLWFLRFSVSALLWSWQLTLYHEDTNAVCFIPVVFALYISHDWLTLLTSEQSALSDPPNLIMKGLWESRALTAQEGHGMSLCCNLISSRIVFRTSFKHSWALERRGVYSEYLSELWVRLMMIS